MERLQEQVRALRDAQHASQDTAQQNARLEVALREMERQKGQALDRIREVEDQLRQSRASVHVLENELRQARDAVPKAPEKKLDLSKAYQIQIRHEPYQACPPLPEGFAYDESELTKSVREKHWAGHDHAVHTVLTQQWPLARVRKEVERLKSVPGLISI